LAQYSPRGYKPEAFIFHLCNGDVALLKSARVVLLADFGPCCFVCHQMLDLLRIVAQAQASSLLNLAELNRERPASMEFFYRKDGFFVDSRPVQAETDT
jgi:hypothetical protein